MKTNDLPLELKLNEVIGLIREKKARHISVKQIPTIDPDVSYVLFYGGEYYIKAKTESGSLKYVMVGAKNKEVSSLDDTQIMPAVNLENDI